MKSSVLYVWLLLIKVTSIECCDVDDDDDDDDDDSDDDDNLD
jgi:hypothetical protein